MNSNNDFKEEEHRKSQEQEIDSLFEDARKELAKVDENAKELKNKSVKNLAKKLERKIPTDTISIEIVNQLRGSISEGFIHECLDDKYKQKHKVENAKNKRRSTRKKKKMII